MFTDKRSPEAIFSEGLDETIVTNPYTGETRLARKGVVASTIQNIVFLNKALQEPHAKDNAEVKDAIKLIDRLIPSIDVVGIFQFFSPCEWLQDDAQPGRQLVAIRYLKRYPEKMNAAIEAQLRQIEMYLWVHAFRCPL